MRWLLIVPAVVVGALLVMGLVGAFLPAEHVASRRARFRQGGDTLWRTLTDFSGFPTWAPEVVKVERLPDRDGHAVWLHQGRRWSARMEVTEFSPPRRFTMEITNPDLPFGGGWTYQVDPDGAGCWVSITERGRIKNPVFRFLTHFVFGYTSTMEGYLKALGRKVGEEVAPEPATAV